MQLNMEKFLPCLRVSSVMFHIESQYFTKARNWRSLTPVLRYTCPGGRRQGRAHTTRGFRDLLSLLQKVKIEPLSHGESPMKGKPRDSVSLW